MRILFRKAYLQKSICFIFTCEKSLYSQSEGHSAVFTRGRITNQRQRKCPLANQSCSLTCIQMAFQIWRLFSGTYKFFSERKKEKKTGCVGWLLIAQLSKPQRGVLLLKKFLVSRNEQRELENIDARDLVVLIANFLLQVRQKNGEQ